MHVKSNLVVLLHVTSNCVINVCRDQGAEGRREEQPPEVGGGRLVMPEDGYEWKKYGQKFIRNIQMIR